MDSTCIPSGVAYLIAFGAGIAAVVLSSWLVLLARAAYRHEVGLRRRLLDATPLWSAGPAGVVTVFGSGDSLIGWAARCVPWEGWNLLGGAVLGAGATLGLIAVIRLMVGRIRVGDRGAPVQAGADDGPLHMESAASATRAPRLPRLSPDGSRVIVEYALTYSAATIAIIVGVGVLHG